MATIRRIQSVEQIRYHLLSVYRRQPTMTLCSKKGMPISVISRFIFDFDRSEEIVLRTAALQLTTRLPVSLRYFIDGYDHHFESQIIAANTVQHAGTFVKIHRPMAIHGVNRRQWMRLCPDDRQPVKVTLDLPSHGSITTSVKDLSPNGFSLLVPADCTMARCQKEVDSVLELPGHGRLRATIVIRNILERKDGIRIGTEINKISDVNQKKLIDYAVAQTIESTCAQRNDRQTPPPTLCLIHDNGKMNDTLAYLEEPYRVIRHDLNGDWKGILRISPDALLFNLDSIKPSSLLPKLRSLANFQETPAIVIADDDNMDIACDAIVLSHFNDPSILIETIEQSISTPDDALELQSAARQPKQSPQPSGEPVLIIDLIGDFSHTLIEAIESQRFRITINTGMTGMLNTVMQIQPVVIVIHARIDVAFKNLLRLLKMNKHTKGLPLIALSADVRSDRKDLEGYLDSSVNLLPMHSEPITVARQIAAIVHDGY